MPMTYASLVADKNTAGSIKYWINYSRIDSDTVLAEAQALIFQRLRVREMRTLDTSITVVATDYRKALPANFLEVRLLRSAPDNLEYKLRSAADVMARRQFNTDGTLIDGPPQYFAIFDEMLQFEARFTTSQTLQLLCFKSPAPLSSGNPSNFLTNRFPHLLRPACLAEAADFMRNDAEYAKQMQRLEALIEATNAESDMTDSAATYDTTVS